MHLRLFYSVLFYSILLCEFLDVIFWTICGTLTVEAVCCLGQCNAQSCLEGNNGWCRVGSTVCVCVCVCVCLCVCVWKEASSVCVTGLSQRTDDAEHGAKHLGWVESVEVYFVSVCVEGKKNPLSFKYLALSFSFRSLYVVAMTTTFTVMKDRGYNFICWTSGYCMCDCVCLLFDSFVHSCFAKMQGACVVKGYFSLKFIGLYKIGKNEQSERQDAVGERKRERERGAPSATFPLLISIHLNIMLSPVVSQLSPHSAGGKAEN